MAKKTKVLTKSAVAAALAATAVVPVIAAPASAATAPVTEVVYVVDGKNVSLSFATFTDALNAEVLNNLDIKYVKAADGNYYSFEDFSDAINASDSVDAALELLANNAAELAKELTDVVEGTVGADGNVTPPATTELAVESVSAINITTVKVTLSKEVDAANADNFSIEGGSVTSATLNPENKKEVTLKVANLKYDTSYTLAAEGLEVDGEVVDFGSKVFKTATIQESWNLEITSQHEVVTANGGDNTVITFKLKNKVTGEVDTAADDMVLEIGATFGNLANTRVTVQNGVGKVVLASEFSTNAVDSKITAQIIEAIGDYRPLIGKVSNEKIVKFVPSAAETDVNAITLTDVESNQADRVVLYFDKDVAPQTFATQLQDGTFATTPVSKAYTSPSSATLNYQKQVFKSGVSFEVKQGSVVKDIVGVKAVDGNSKAIELILAKETVISGNLVSNTLEDNQKVEVTAVLGTSNVTKDFILTDARKPEVTSITPEDLTTLKIKYSEAIATGTHKIDGLLTEGTDFGVEYGEFNPKTLEDLRATATLKLGNYTSGNKAGTQRFFETGSHSLTVTQLKDFAGLTDNANVSTSQTLNFTIAADDTKPSASVVVESPEQFRVTFDKSVLDAVTVDDEFFETAFEYYNTETSTWENVKSGLDQSGVASGDLLVVVKHGRNSFVVELEQDWQKVLNTELTNDTYHNYKFRFKLPADSFTNAANGKKNVEQILDLSYVGSPLTFADNVSPTISSIVKHTGTDNQYIVTMNEPVKIQGDTDGSADNAGATLNEAQKATGLPQVLVEFQGTNKDGKAVVVNGSVGTYADDTNGADKAFYVTPDAVLQELVDEDGYSENWKLVVKSISDDVGNTAPTDTEDFVVSKSTGETTDFYITNVEAFNYTGSDQDRIEITFNKAVVNNGGINDLTSVSNWTLNGSSLANVASVTVANAVGTEEDGYEKVIITFTDDRALSNTSNTIAVNKSVLSKDGTILTRGNEKVAVTIDATTELALLNALSTSVPGADATIDRATNTIDLVGVPSGALAVDVLDISALANAVPNTITIPGVAGVSAQTVTISNPAAPTATDIANVKTAIQTARGVADVTTVLASELIGVTLTYGTQTYTIGSVAP